VPTTALLDHVSLIAERAALARLGFELAPTAGDPEHARVLLDRSYLEVRSGDAAGGEMRASGWFLRPADLDATVATLREHGFACVGPTAYEGVDGTWLDLRVEAEPGAWLPTLTVRSDRSEWPPPLERPQPNGATRLAAVRVRSDTPVALRRMLDALAVDAGAVELDPSPGPPGITVLRLARAAAEPLTLDLAI
jgi:Glyoxalase-like domain